jgi:UDP:flavonoid glycosyltransferase YjiC (YdhE family)
MSCASLGRALSARGHSIAFMFRELRQLAVMPETRAYTIFQAPRSPREGMNVAVPASFADMLLGCGYADARELAALAGGWRSLFARWRPDLVVADYAPTALLAASTLGIPRVMYGNGFFSPPRFSPLPPFRIDEAVDPARVAASDAAARAAVNDVRRTLGHAPLARLADLFEVAEDFLCTFPELDHYGDRPASGYWGPRARFDQGLQVDWPEAPRKRVFVYLKRGCVQLDAIIQWLVAADCTVIAFIPELEPERRARLASPRRIVAERPVRLDMLMRHCDLAISHGGEIAAGILLAGVPQLTFPTHYEQYLTALRIAQLGAGAWLGPGASAREVSAALEQALALRGSAEAAHAYARHYAAFSPQDQRRRIAARIDQILAASPARASILSRSPPSGAQE